MAYPCTILIMAIWPCSVRKNIIGMATMVGNGSSQSGVEPLVLVYYKVRGKLQPIRNLIYYLGVPFIEIYLGDEEQKKSPPA